MTPPPRRGLRAASITRPPQSRFRNALGEKRGKDGSPSPVGGQRRKLRPSVRHRRLAAKKPGSNIGKCGPKGSADFSFITEEISRNYFRSNL